MTVPALSDWSESDRQAVREQLDRIVRSAPFHQSRRRQRFLEYIVTETLAGRGDRLKGYTVAVEVFDRPPTFDANIDPIVRMEAARLRDKLREYYDGDGRADPVRIELPKGSYAPQITLRQGTTAETEPERSDATSPAEERIALVAEPPSPERPWSQRLARWHIAVPAAALILALILALGASGLWLARQRPAPEPHAAADTVVPRLPKGPAIAVLPFTNLSGDPKQEYFSDGITEDILTELAGARDLRVLARNTTFQYKGQAVDVAKLGRELGVRYVLEGSVRRSDDRLRVTAQLIDAETGTHVWAERFDREMADVFLVQDEIVNQIVAKIAGGYGAIERTEAKSADRKSTKGIQAYDLVLHAREIIQWDWTNDTFRAAREALQQAIALDPSNAQARRELAWLAVCGWIFGLDDTPVPPDEITAQATKAVELDPTDARARMVAAAAYFFTKRLDLFARESDQALALAPYDAEIMSVLACMISSAGDHERGVALATQANALNADASIGWYHSTLYTAYYLAGDYERALEVAHQNKDAEMFYSYLEIIPIYGKLGRREEAAEAFRNLQKNVPGASAATFESWWRLWNIRDDEVAKLMDGVYAAGVLGEAAKPSQ